MRKIIGVYEKRAKEEFPNLTKGLKKVANHLLTDPMVFAIHPVKKVGEIIGVSETMVIRFAIPSDIKVLVHYNKM